jgi:23S rRNA (uracil1939-C5)-methyltransferase
MAKKTIKIEKMVHGGLGLSRTDEGVVFVEGVMPEETVETEISAGAHVRGSLVGSCVAIVEASPMRREAVCPMFGPNGCGGCDWMYMTYDAQLSIKEEIFRETCARIGRIPNLPSLVVTGSPELGYRRRVQFKIDPDKKQIGFFRKKSNSIAPLLHCPLLCEPLNGLLEEMPSNFNNIAPSAREIKALFGSQDASLGRNGSETYATIASSPVVQGVTGANTVICCDSYTFRLSGGGFFQSNLFLAPKLGLLAAEWCCGETFFDLYGGGGFFSVFAASRFSRGFCVDISEDHAVMARQTFADNGITSVAVEKNTVLGFLKRAISEKIEPDCCIVDPPRTGLEPGVAPALAKLRPRTILYVSCDPATQARDAAYLIGQGSYHLEKTALFDCYPQTHHIETVMLLTRAQ